jgi:hypothetical protein
MSDAWVKILTDPNGGKWMMRPDEWVEIMTGPGIAAWIEEHDSNSWAKPYPGIYWLSPALYILWKLKWA